MRRKLSHKTRLKKALIKRKGIKNYEPTEQVAYRWFHILNRTLFENKLSPVKITVRRMKSCMGLLTIKWDGRLSRAGTCNQNHLPYHNPSLHYDMTLHHKFKTWRDFLETLAHEMVHQYQVEVQKDKTANHNQSFFALRE